MACNSGELHAICFLWAHDFFGLCFYERYNKKQNRHIERAGGPFDEGQTAVTAHGEATAHGDIQVVQVGCRICSTLPNCRSYLMEQNEPKMTPFTRSGLILRRSM